MVSLRSRLTAWYSLLLVLTIAVFSVSILWLHWRLLLDATDEGLRSISATAANVVEEELEESKDLHFAASEMVEVVRAPDGAVQVLDQSGAPVFPPSAVLPVPPGVGSNAFVKTTQTLIGPGNKPWRITARRGKATHQAYIVIVGTPLDESLEQWWRLVRACLIGIPVALALAIGGGLLLGRHGLRPLTTMAADAQGITASTLETRLSVPASTTELDQFARSFNRVVDSLASALSTQRRFMADASHELRTPISIMRTAADVTLSQPSRDDAEYREALSTVAQQSSRLTRLVDDMLVLARADGGGYPIVMAPVDFTAVVRGCITDLSGLAEDRSISVDAQLEPVALRGDEALLRRLFSNLLTNALWYTAPGGTVAVSLTHTDTRVTLRVADTGGGIPPEEHERVFERFVRLDPARASGGAGLGLAIARWVAEAHGGSVRIISSGPGGSVFAADLPA